MNAKDIQQMRRSRVGHIQRTRLGGVDRITVDRERDDAPWERYAHIYENGLGTNLHDMPTPDPAEAYLDGSWRPVGIIDLDTGHLFKRGEGRSAMSDLEVPVGYRVIYQHFLGVSNRPPLGMDVCVDTMVTVVRLEHGDFVMAEGRAMVNPNYDCYDRKLGNRIALGRALKRLPAQPQHLIEGQVPV